MIDNRDEYARMYDVERSLWWYKILHGQIIAQIRKHFGHKADLCVLDAACGTGGLLSFLRDHGFTQLAGFDYSQHAIDFSIARHLDVSFGDLRKVELYRPGTSYDIIICNDALYFLSDQEIVQALAKFKSRLNPNGLLLINIHAFNAFAGTHDLAVGSTRRFVLSDFKKYTQAAGLHLSYSTYWPFFLSLPIWAARQWQRFQLRRNPTLASGIKSDVQYPGHLINSTLHAVTRAEQWLLSRAPFGSSLFLVMKNAKTTGSFP